ncbi:unnamed protein product [Diamesa hyperborea]
MVCKLIEAFTFYTKFMISVSGIDHCSEHLYQKSQNASHMQFTRETVSQEYAVEGLFKSLHCCAKGYRSIEWFKDGKPYPWSSETLSSLILYPEAANQTIYTRNAGKIDQGKYVCVLRNDTHKSEQYIDLQVKSNSPDIPLATFQPKSLHLNLGEPARFYCEAFIGKVDLPDVRSYFKWYQLFDDDHKVEISKGDSIQKDVIREDGQIVGSYIFIPHIKAHNYGRYMCQIDIGNSPTHRLEMTSLLIFEKPISALQDNLLFNPYLLAAIAAFFTIMIVFLLRYTRQYWVNYLINFNSNELETLNCKTKKLDVPMPSVSNMKICPKVRHNKNDDIKIMMQGI